MEQSVHWTLVILRQDSVHANHPLGVVVAMSVSMDLSTYLAVVYSVVKIAVATLVALSIRFVTKELANVNVILESLAEHVPIPLLLTISQHYSKINSNSRMVTLHRERMYVTYSMKNNFRSSANEDTPNSRTFRVKSSTKSTFSSRQCIV